MAGVSRAVGRRGQRRCSTAERVGSAPARRVGGNSVRARSERQQYTEQMNPPRPTTACVTPETLQEIDNKAYRK